MVLVTEQGPLCEDAFGIAPMPLLLLSSPGWGQGVFPPGPLAIWLPPAQGLPEPSPPTHLLTSTTPPPLSLLPHNLMGEGQHSLAQPIVQCPLNLGWGGGRRGRGCQLYADIPQPS